MRNEYPRPQLQRADWQSLNGPWAFAFDPKNIGLRDAWFAPDHTLPDTIEVPFCPESPLSGIENPERHEHVWYQKRFTIPESWGNRRIILHFGAVDYRASVYVNGAMVTRHTGGHVGFHVDITDALTARWSEGEEQVVTVYVSDPSYDEAIPRGKQSWTDKPHGIWYTRTTGIWQSVWLEPVAPVHIERVLFTPDIDRGMVRIDTELGGLKRFPEMADSTWRLDMAIRFEDQPVVSDTCAVLKHQVVSRELDVFGESAFDGLAHGARRCWWPHSPNLFNVTLTLYREDEAVDTLDAYFGMRKLHTERGMLYLNNVPFYPKLVLDQGYWPEGLMTAPEDEAFVKDIEMMKAMGFNGCRKHQKVEDPRFLYWADKLGFVVWGEMAAASIYTRSAAMRLQHEWAEVIARDYNHPSIIAWVPFNESWGVPEIKTDPAQQAHTLSLYHMIKSLDQTRPVITNDGWVMTDTDIVAIHNYAHGDPDREEDEAKVRFFRELMQDPELLLSDYHAGRPIFADGFGYRGQPIMLTEVGGIAYQNDATDSWGYTQAGDEAAYLRQLEHVFTSIYRSPYVVGVCYTQLSDVEQETNGLVTYDRAYKVAPEKIRAIVDQWRPAIAKRIPAEE